eukprot:scaffold14745_cov70-Cyclotella_meneghiniana.AAC.2
MIDRCEKRRSSEFGCFDGVPDPISGRVACGDGQTMANLEVRELKKRISPSGAGAITAAAQHPFF